MEKIKKSYIERIKKGLWKKETMEVEDRNPLKVDDDYGTTEAFRFYDQEFVEEGGKRFAGEKSNFSKWIFFGERVSLSEVKELFGNCPLADDMERYNVQHVCYTKVGSYLPMSDGDMTYKEKIDALVNEKENKIVKIK